MVRVGAVQAEPVWFDLDATVDKTISLIEEAGKQNIDVLAFPEVWIPGYPWPIWTQNVSECTEVVHKYMANSLSRESKQMERIKSAVKDAGIVVVLGYSERDGGSLYIAQSYIVDGEIIHHRRKIKPTHVERSIWGEGQANSLKTVVDTKHGKVGALCCFEHYQPLLRYYEYAQGVQIHVAAWPPLFETNALFQATPSGARLTSQFLAMEGQAFVLVSTQVLKKENFKMMGLPDKENNEGGGGFAMIYSPEGRQLVKALPANEEGILQADIDLQDIDYSKIQLDPVGQYSRPDLMTLLVNTKEGKHVIELE